MTLRKRLDRAFAGETFPVTTSELVASHGDIEVELPNGAVTLREVLAPLPEETYESEEDACTAAYGALGDEAIGRKEYSDRDPTSLGELGPEPVSL